jgi:hypothetical protein
MDFIDFVFFSMTSFALGASMLLLPVAVISLMRYDKQNTIRVFQILSVGLCFSFLGAGAAKLFNYFVHNEKGVFGLVIGFWSAVALWTVFAKIYFKLTWLSLLLIAMLPISFLGYFWGVQSFIYRLNEPKREELHRASRVEDYFKAIRLSIEEFQSRCGRFPRNLDALILDPGNCPKWEKSVYQSFVGDGLLKDPWGAPFQYESDEKTYFKVTTLGADGKTGGEGPNSDQILRGP